MSLLWLLRLFHCISTNINLYTSISKIIINFVQINITMLIWNSFSRFYRISIHLLLKLGSLFWEMGLTTDFWIRFYTTSTMLSSRRLLLLLLLFIFSFESTRFFWLLLLFFRLIILKWKNWSFIIFWIWLTLFKNKWRIS